MPHAVAPRPSPSPTMWDAGQDVPICLQDPNEGLRDEEIALHQPQISESAQVFRGVRFLSVRVFVFDGRVCEQEEALDAEFPVGSCATMVFSRERETSLNSSGAGCRTPEIDEVVRAVPREAKDRHFGRVIPTFLVRFGRAAKHPVERALSLLLLLQHIPRCLASVSK